MIFYIIYLSMKGANKQMMFFSHHTSKYELLIMSKKYMCIAKVDNKKFVRFHVNNLKKFSLFLDQKFPGWRWFNVFEYTRDHNGKQLDSFTNRKRPVKAFL